MLSLAACRYDELHRGHPLRQFVVELERSGRAERLELEGLEREDVAEQITAIVGRRPERAVLDAVYARCEGNPFFVEELLANSPEMAAAADDAKRFLDMERTAVVIAGEDTIIE